MAYIGSKPSTKFSAAAKVDTFTGDGSTTTFDLANIIPAGGENALQVFVNNVRQKPGASNAFTVGNDGSGDLKRVTFTEAPAASDEIYVITPFEATNISEVGDGTITSAKIADGTIANVDVSPSAAIADSKLATLTTASKVNVSALSAPGSADVFLRGDRTYGAIPTDQIDTNAFNISLLGFKMAVNEGLTVFNLVDGVVDEFNDESGTDESEGSNDTYCATNDFYQNQPLGCSYSAGFSTTAITEPDTSTTGTNPAQGSGTFGTFTVPCCMTSITYTGWGASGASGATTSHNSGGGGFATGNLAVTASQVLYVGVAEGGLENVATPQSNGGAGFGFAQGGKVGPSNPACGPGTRWGGGGGGGSGIGAAASRPQTSAPQVYFVSGGGAGSGAGYGAGGGGGGLTGQAGGIAHNSDYDGGVVAQTAHSNSRGDANSPGPYFGGGGGGGQTTGGAGGQGQSNEGSSGAFLIGGAGAASSGTPVSNGGGGGGYYGGGGGGNNCNSCAGGAGGGSSYYGHPQVSSASTCSAGGTNPNPQLGPTPSSTAAGKTNPLYVACTAEGTDDNADAAGEDGYVFLTGSVAGLTTSTTIVSTAFSANSVPTSSRIVVFEENVDTPTLNTDIVASISRDGGSTFTTATLSDSGYVTGSSGQRILTGQATISGQPSGQSMRWKLALANNTVKIHGVSLQWS